MNLQQKRQRKKRKHDFFLMKTFLFSKQETFNNLAQQKKNDEEKRGDREDVKIYSHNYCIYLFFTLLIFKLSLLHEDPIDL